MESKARALQEALIDGRADEVALGIQSLLGQGISATEILNDTLLPGMDVVGARFEQGLSFIPEMMTAARAMRRALEILEPFLAGGSTETSRYRIVLGTVEGDIHEFGKNLVGMMLRGAGFAVRDLGVDVRPERFVAAARDGADVLGISCLISTTMINVPRVLDALVAARVRDGVQVIVGGSPMNQDFADAIGADAYAPNAVRAVDRVKAMLGEL